MTGSWREALIVFRAYLVRDFLMATSYRLAFGLQIFTLFTTVVSFYFLSKLVGAHPAVSQYGGYLPFVIIGIAMSTFITTGFGSFSSSIRQEQMMGTLEAVLMTPLRIPVMVIATALWPFFWAVLTTIFTIGCASLLFGIRLHGNWLGALLVLILTTITFSSLGIISASFIMVFKRGDPMHMLIGGVSFLLGGVAYPVSELPGWLQPISKMLPITHGLNGMRSLLLEGQALSEIWPQLLILGLFVAVCLPLSLLCFQKAVNIARRDGTLLHY